MTPLCYRFRLPNEAVPGESNRWNPLADVAELVDALVSGAASDYYPQQAQVGGRGPPPFFRQPIHLAIVLQTGSNS